MKVFLIFISTTLIICIIGYLAWSLIEGGFNVFKWDKSDRITFIIINCTAGLYVGANVADDYLKKQVK